MRSGLSTGTNDVGCTPLPRRQNNYFGFGSDNDMEMTSNYLIIRHSPFPINEPPPGTEGHDPLYRVPCRKVFGRYRDRKHSFRPESIVNISAMSFGSLSGPAIEALNRGAEICGCLHNTGEGGVSKHHQQGGELIWQIGTGYFGCRKEDGRFDLPSSSMWSRPTRSGPSRSS